MPKKLGDTGGMQPRKLPKPKQLGDYKPSNRFSFRVPGDKPQPVDSGCGELDIPDYTRNNTDIGRASGYAVEYSPDQLENYKRQYPRLERAINLIPDSKVEGKGSNTYLFCSNRAPGGYWQVQVLFDVVEYYLEAGEPLQIICPVPFPLKQIETNAPQLIWEQLEGGRLAVIDPPTAINPILYILDNVRDSRPIRFKISIPDSDVSDELIIYTTPTSNFDGVSYERAIASPDTAPCRAVPNTLRPGSPPFPQYLQRAYTTEPGTYTFTWDLPSCDTQFLVDTVWQANTTGQYIDVQKFPVNSNRSFTAQLNTHYRVLSVFNVYGHVSVKDSQRFYFTSGNQLVLGDDNYNGLSFTPTKSTANTLPLGRIGLTYNDILNGLSFTPTKVTKITLPLGVIRQSNSDNYNGLSFTSIKTTIQKQSLGGVIIR